VDFESGGRRGTGVTANLSETGLHLSSVAVFGPGTRLAGTVRLPSGEDASFVAEVRWARKLRGADALAMQNSMGVEFLEAPAPSYLEFLRTHLDPSFAAARPRSDPAVVAPARGSTPTPAEPRTAGRLRLGLDGLSTLILSATDALSSERPRECVLTAARATSLLEDAAARAVEGFLPERSRLVTVQLELGLLGGLVLPIGTTLAAACRLGALSADGATLTFEGSVSALRRELAKARLTSTIAPL